MGQENEGNENRLSQNIEPASKEERWRDPTSGDTITPPVGTTPPPEVNIVRGDPSDG